jgi:hypothetical protein
MTRFQHSIRRRGPAARRAPALAAAVLASLLIAAPAALAVTVPSTDSDLAQRAFRDPALHVSAVYTPAPELPAALAAVRTAQLAGLGVAPDHGFVDRRTGAWGTLLLSRPLVPGSGAGNALSWTALSLPAPASPEQLEAAVWQALEGFLAAHAAALGVPLGELGTRSITAVAGGQVVQVHVAQVVDGVPVRGAFLSAVVNHGNLVLLGSRNWAPVTVPTTATVTAAAARAAAEAHAGRTAAGLWQEPRLELVPVAIGEDPAAVAVGAGLGHRLVWSVGLDFAGDHGSWEALVDARSGELLSFTDANHYVKGVRGGVFPTSNDGIGPEGTEQPGYPMPFADVRLDSGELLFTDSGGDLVCAADGSSIETTLSGRYVRIADTCGAVADGAADPDDLDLGAGPGTDCAVPPGRSAGDTHSARTGFYEVNRIQEIARGWLPDNPWLHAQLTANMNIEDTCNAFWDGSTINFYKSGGGCRNTGEIAAVFDHEWGHGLDDNDASPDVSAPGEAYADIAAMLRLNTSCIGRGFDDADLPCGGNGDPCLECSGVREVDWAKRQSGQPHDLDWVNSPAFLDRGGCIDVFLPTQQGPCGWGTHCEGSMASEAVWDLVKRDLPAFAGAGFVIDGATAQEMVQRSHYLAGGALGNWYNCNPVAPAGQHGDGCNADGAYLNYLAVDDDNGDLTDGTPHMPAIHAAFDRHQIACAQPLPAAGASCTRPSAAPQVTATPGNKGVELSWQPVAGATKYWVFRSDGVLACSFGKARVGETAATSFVDSGLAHDLPYAYTVMAVGSSDSCTGPASPCLTVTPGAGADLAFTEEPPYLAALSGGDGDPFVDNCESGRVGFAVRNNGEVALSNVRVAHIEPLTHPGLEITSAPSFAATLGPCAEAEGGFDFVASGLAPNDEVVFRVDVTADELAGRTVSTVARFIAAESDFEAVASRTWSFDDGLDGWQVVSGSFSHNGGPGGNGGLGYLESSSLQDDRCDRARSPVVRLTEGSTLELHNQYVIEPGEGTGTGVNGWFDRANVGLLDLASGERTTVSPDGGRLYEASGPNGVCVTQGQPGWAGPGPGFLASTWSAGALDPAGAWSGRIAVLDVAYGADALAAGLGFQFDEVTLTDFEAQVADAQPDACPVTPPPPCGRVDDGAAAVEYRHGWHRRGDDRASAGGYHRRVGNGKNAAAARVVFTGDAITYHYVESNLGGTADLYLDGELVETLSYGGGGQGKEEPTFGHSVTFDGLGAGAHELVIEHRSGAVYVDGFELACGDPSAAADESAVESRSATATHTVAPGGALLVRRDVPVGTADRELSVVVEGSTVPLTVRLLDPLGLVVASGGALLDGLALSGLDAALSRPGTYRLEVLRLDATTPLEISVARTYEVP